ncbi:hypothetical protein NP493_54g01034 [Ridgeia piscesae]|uniref:Uncharacterized protein n=1 Tax=Ridgeia piscesae TaxID=27915 RepID=A0AAD9PAQ6_RIDPI|nr:hypothetical protein NP493_54g01034 [Ridgeia piscesae]
MIRHFMRSPFKRGWERTAKLESALTLQYASPFVNKIAIQSVFWQCATETWRHVLKLLGTKIQTYWLVIYYFTFLHSFTKHFLMCFWLHHHDIYVVMFVVL